MPVQAADVPLLIELLTDYELLNGRPLYLIGYAEDSWDLVIRYVLDGFRAGYVAAHSRQSPVVLVVSDALAFGQVDHAREIPAAGPGLARAMAKLHGPARMELSAPWAAAIRRMRAGWGRFSCGCVAER